VIEDLPMRVERRGRKVFADDPRLLVRKKGVEDFIAEDQCERQFLRVPPDVVGKFFSQAKCARGDARFQHLSVLASALQVLLGRRPRQRGTQTTAVDAQVELNAIRSRCHDAAFVGSVIHCLCTLERPRRLDKNEARSLACGGHTKRGAAHRLRRSRHVRK
jgi:hypothetical protein